MPFTTQEDRQRTDAAGPDTVGDRCFLFYREMRREWKKSPRWTTAHKLYMSLLTARRDRVLDDSLAAHDLAWQVFFALNVIPYEIRKREENGDVE